jgi:uncharacterized protein YndB with AHSA1/START domain
MEKTNSPAQGQPKNEGPATSETRSIEKTVTIDASAEAVWRALTDAEEITRWFAPEARVTPGKGGSIWVSWGGGMDGSVNTIEIWEPQKHLRHPSGKNGETKVPLAMDYVLEGKGGSTVLRMVHSGFAAGADWDGEFDSFDRGWEIYAINLKYYLERHAGKKCIQRSFMAKSPLPREQAWSALMGTAGFDRDGTLGTPARGAPYRAITATGDELAGTVQLFAPGRDFAATVSSLDDALLRVSFEKSRTGTFVFGVLLTYGVDAARTDALAKELETLAAQMA